MCEKEDILNRVTTAELTTVDHQILDKKSGTSTAKTSNETSAKQEISQQKANAALISRDKVRLTHMQDSAEVYNNKKEL